MMLSQFTNVSQGAFFCDGAKRKCVRCKLRLVLDANDSSDLQPGCRIIDIDVASDAAPARGLVRNVVRFEVEAGVELDRDDCPGD